MKIAVLEDGRLYEVDDHLKIGDKIFKNGFNLKVIDLLPLSSFEDKDIN